MKGHDVFEPMGLDGFGIHSENYALKVNRHPQDQAKISQKKFYQQLRATGNAFDWQHTLETYDPEYYQWTQWLFIEMFKHALAYRAKAEVNWCPSCKTVLADEQVLQKSKIKNQKSKFEIQIGICERCSTEVVKKELEQWFFRITAYAEKLLQNTYKPTFNWTEKVKTGQRNWIGKKEGIVIKYKISNINLSINSGLTQSEVEWVKNQKLYIDCFTTRPDTNFGATFIVLAPENPLCLKITTPENYQKVKISTSGIVKQTERQKEKQEVLQKTAASLSSLDLAQPV